MTYRPIGKIRELASTFLFPLAIISSLLGSLLIQYWLHLPSVARGLQIVVVLGASIPLFVSSFRSLLSHSFALDYIALLAIIVAAGSGQFLVAMIIILMLSGGETLERYGTSQAKQSLTALTDRIPNSVLLWENGEATHKVPIDSVRVNTSIFVRKGEVIPLDGILVSHDGFADESSLTGEPYAVEKVKGDRVRSGTVNVGESLVIQVTKESKDSTYHSIIEMVRAAQKEKAPLIRLADRYSVIFTVITLLLAGFAYAISHDFGRVLAVLVIATPCPLILATPIALMGGMNAAARHRIIMKKLSSIEVLSRVKAIVFDKTGTITLGKPTVQSARILDPHYSENEVYGIADAIERNSLHPLAKAITIAAKSRASKKVFAYEIEEKVGVGITGVVNGKHFQLSSARTAGTIAIEMKCGEKVIAVFELEDKLKSHSSEIIGSLHKLGLDLYLFTGDTAEAAAKVSDQLGTSLHVKANCSPEDKKNGIEDLQKQGKITAMIGDGINDAPALAMADVGLVFSNEEQTASSEAADIIFLGGDFSSVTQVIRIAKETIRIALQSILFGIGLSVLGMIASSFGWISPITGAFVQEIIDVLVILNALRSTRLK